jgi:septation ring formation regulator EzrA
MDVQRQLAGQNRELCQLAETNGQSRAKRDSQLENLRGAIDKITKKQQHERNKVSGLQEAVGEVRRQIDCVMIKLSETEEAVERRRWDWRRRRIGCLGSHRMSQVCRQ